MSKPFGYSLLLDCYGCFPGAADNLELIYRYLEELVDRLGMTKMSAPIVIHGPREQGQELYPDKLGVSGWVPLIESGIQLHAIEPTRFITIDIYSCRAFRVEPVIEFTNATFVPDYIQQQFLERGNDY